MINTFCTLYVFAPFILIVYQFIVTQLCYICMCTTVSFSRYLLDNQSLIYLLYFSSGKFISKMICESYSLCLDAYVPLLITYIYLPYGR